MAHHRIPAPRFSGSPPTTDSIPSIPSEDMADYLAYPAEYASPAPLEPRRSPPHRRVPSSATWVSSSRWAQQPPPSRLAPTPAPAEDEYAYTYEQHDPAYEQHDPVYEQHDSAYAASPPAAAPAQEEYDYEYNDEYPEHTYAPPPVQPSGPPTEVGHDTVPAVLPPDAAAAPRRSFFRRVLGREPARVPPPAPLAADGADFAPSVYADRAREHEYEREVTFVDTGAVVLPSEVGYAPAAPSGAGHRPGPEDEDAPGRESGERTVHSGSAHSHLDGTTAAHHGPGAGGVPMPHSPVFLEPLPTSDFDKMSAFHTAASEQHSLRSYVDRTLQFLRDLHDLPWASSRVAADYVPGDAPRARYLKFKQRHPHGGLAPHSWYATAVHQAVDLLEGERSDAGAWAPHAHAYAVPAGYTNVAHVYPAPYPDQYAAPDYGYGVALHQVPATRSLAFGSPRSQPDRARSPQTDRARSPRTDSDARATTAYETALGSGGRTDSPASPPPARRRASGGVGKKARVSWYSTSDAGSRPASGLSPPGSPRASRYTASPALRRPGPEMAQISEYAPVPPASPPRSAAPPPRRNRWEWEQQQQQQQRVPIPFALGR